MEMDDHNGIQSALADSDQSPSQHFPVFLRPIPSPRARLATQDFRKQNELLRTVSLPESPCWKLAKDENPQGKLDDYYFGDEAASNPLPSQDNEFTLPQKDESQKISDQGSAQSRGISSTAFTRPASSQLNSDLLNKDSGPASLSLSTSALNSSEKVISNQYTSTATEQRKASTSDVDCLEQDVDREGGIPANRAIEETKTDLSAKLSQLPEASTSDETSEAAAPSADTATAAAAGAENRCREGANNSISGRRMNGGKPRLILHVDINKTIIIKDQVQGAGSDSMVNILLSECAWGRLMPGPDWIPVGRLATDRPLTDLGLMTYRSYLDTFYLPFKQGFGKDIDKENEDIKAKRQALKRTFTEPGQPGDMFRGVYEKLMAALKVPEAKQQEMLECGLGASDELFILPSFFALLCHLAAQKRDFTIVFRTFGTDLPEILTELNTFCRGQHPLHPGVSLDGSDGKNDLQLKFPDSCGCFFRFGLSSEGTLLALRPPASAISSRGFKPEILQGCDEANVLRSFQEIYHALLAACCQDGQNRSLAFRDYYPWWKAHQERAKSGKLLLVDPGDDGIHQMFFDDNIGSGNPHIVDARDVRTGRPIPFAESNNRFLIKVEPLHAILDKQYFIRAVRRCEDAQLEKDRMERPEHFPRPSKSKWTVVKRGLMNIVRLAQSN